MRSTVAYLKSVSRIALSLGLMSQMLSLPVLAAEPAVPGPVHIPPSIQAAPTLLPEVPEAEKPIPKAIPPESAAPPSMTVAQAQIQKLVEQGVFPEDAITRTTPFNRAELATIFVKALKHDTTLVSEFPFYRDVPVNHAQYVPIEVARAKKLLVYPDEHGFYHPEKPVIYAEVYRGIAQAITGPPPSEEVTKQMLEHVVDKDLIPEELLPSVAKMSRARFFYSENAQDITLRPEELVFADGLAPLVTGLMQLIEKRAVIVQEDMARPLLPEGLVLSMTPATAILEVQLNVGATVNFSLVRRVPPLRRGTRLKGIVKESLPGQAYVIDIVEATTPEGEIYQTSAEFTLSFASKGKLSFFVPGELFAATTRTPLMATPAANTPTSSQPDDEEPEPITPSLPPVQPSGSLENKAAPNSVPRLSK